MMQNVYDYLQIHQGLKHLQRKELLLTPTSLVTVGFLLHHTRQSMEPLRLGNTFDNL